jgi:hypothetical protein
LTNLLGGQSNFLSSALPNELKGVMGLADLGKQASEAVSSAARGATRAATQAVPAAPASSPLGWLLPLLALAALGFLGYTFMSGSKKEEVKKPITSAPNAVPATAPAIKPAPEVAAAPLELPKLELPGGMSIEDLQKKLAGSFDGITETLGSITDVDTAKGAVSKLEEAAKAYADLGMDSMPAAATGTLAPFIKPYFEKVGGLLNTLYLIPGVKEIIEPVLGPMVQSVSKMMG